MPLGCRSEGGAPTARSLIDTDPRMSSATIKLFLPFGDPRRLRTVEISNRSGKAGAELEACRSLVDMDEHLDDARKDFRNPQIAELLSLVS